MTHTEKKPITLYADYAAMTDNEKGKFKRNGDIPPMDKALLLANMQRLRIREYSQSPDREIKGVLVRDNARGEAVYEGESLHDALFGKGMAACRITPNRTGGLSIFPINGTHLDAYAFSNKAMAPCHLLDMKEEDWIGIFGRDCYAQLMQ